MSTDVVVRPVRDVDAEMLGRVHAQCWHEDYDTIVSAATLATLSPLRLAELWTHWMNQGEGYHQYAALVDHQIVGFTGSGPARDEDAPRPKELYFLHLLDAFHGRSLGQQLLEAAVGTEPAYLWVPDANEHAVQFYLRNGFAPDGVEHDEPFLGTTIHEIRLVR
ncbi:GNAT family N-acetyltransferase [Rathayibacter sp. YIM 133350]|uniref:GNAT family N-acetyltransferase n=1 Tax=Rathayibacter sp. YIM 133350 TaxID=3131992 RepID=UPI00307E71D2